MRLAAILAAFRASAAMLAASAVRASAAMLAASAVRASAAMFAASAVRASAAMLAASAVRASAAMLAASAVLVAATTVSAGPPTTCGGTDDYARALCAYQKRNFADAEAGFKAVSERADDAKAIPATYFLARTWMKQGRYDEASTLFIRIYETAPPFYREWNCDFLLGECRKALGKG
jgi:TolA-binding protein